MEEHKTEIAYWAGRLIGYDQAWEVAKEIVDTINEAQKEVKIFSSNPLLADENCLCTGRLELERVDGITYCCKCRRRFV